MEKNENKRYAHIVQPWKKYYDESFYSSELPEMTILNYIKEKNSSNLDGTALSYYGKKWTYSDFFDCVDSSSKVLSYLGLGYDDRVMYMMPNIPETAHLLYGGSQIGVISDYIDPRPDSVDLSVSAKKVLSLVDEEKIKQLIVLDQCYLGMIKPIENELRELGMQNIVTISPSSSMDTLAKLRYLKEVVDFNGIKALKHQSAKMKMMESKMREAIVSSPLDVINYSELIGLAGDTRFKSVGFEPKKLEAIVHTSGTSGNKPKPIPLTTENLNAYANQTFGGHMPMDVGDRALQILPYFAAFGLCGVVHGGLCHGCELVQIPEFSPVNFGKLILKYRPQIIIGTPTWFLSMIEDKSLQNADLSFLKMVTYGGDSMEPTDEIRINEFLKKHNCKCVITKGHGMSETCGCASYANHDYNKLGTMGIPMPGVTYSVCDPETKEFIEFTDDKDYIEGELLISSKTTTPGVLDGRVIVQHEERDGFDFIYTRDLARMDKDGVMSFVARKDRSFTRFDGYKYRSYEVENIIKSLPDVKYCIISPYFDNEKYGNMPFVDIVLNKELCSQDEKVEFVKYLIQTCFVENPNVSSRQVPSRFRFRTEMPFTKNSKVDINRLKEETELAFDVVVELEETNISIGNINIYPAERSKKLNI